MSEPCVVIRLPEHMFECEYNALTIIFILLSNIKIAKTNVQGILRLTNLKKKVKNQHCIYNKTNLSNLLNMFLFEVHWTDQYPG